MASYTIECTPYLQQDVYGSNSSEVVDSNNPTTNYFDDYFKHISVDTPNIYYYRYPVNDHYSTLLKFITSTLSAYKKKKISAVLMQITPSQWDSGTYIGGVLSWLNSTYNATTVTYSTKPSGNDAFCAYTEAVGRDPHNLPIQYYQTGFVGYGGGAAPRSFYDQLSVGFMLSNNAKYADKKAADYAFDSVHSIQDESKEKNFKFIFYFEDWSPTLTAQFPISGAFVSPFKANTFSVSFDAFDSISYPTVQTVTYETKDVSTGTVTSHTASVSINLSGRTSVSWSVPANTFISGKDYQWRAMFTTDDGTTGWSNWADFTTHDAVPGQPTIVSPQSKYLTGSDEIALSWHHNIETGSVQHAFDLQYQQSGSWTDIAVHTVSSAQTYTLPANYFSAGTMRWRVRTYNTDDVVGDWGTSSQNIVRAKPVAPIISDVTDAPRVSVSWQSTGQQAYRLTISNASGTVWDSGEEYGVIKQITIDRYLPDDLYTVSLSIQNGLGLWSDTVTRSVLVENVPPTGDEVLSAASLFGAVRLDLTVPATPETAARLNEAYVNEPTLVDNPTATEGDKYILRDGIPIAKILGTSYIDYTAYKNHTYVCRYTQDGYYRDTNAVTAGPNIPYACIAKIADPQKVLTLKFNEGQPPRMEQTISKSTNQHYFSGRSLPAYDVTEHHDSAWTFTYSLLNSADYDTLYQLLIDGDPVMLRTHSGVRATGVLTSLNRTPGKSYTSIGFKVEETAVDEEISYE